MKVGVIGLGSMGMGAALNLHRKGHAVTDARVMESRVAVVIAREKQRARIGVPRGEGPVTEETRRTCVGPAHVRLEHQMLVGNARPCGGR